jgi:hypothetical protein
MPIFWRCSGYGSAEDGGCFVGLIRLAGERYVNVFKDGLGSDAAYAVRGLDQVIAGASGLFAAERVGEDEWFGELTGAHQETGAVYGPLVVWIHGGLVSSSGVRFQVSGLRCQVSVLSFLRRGLRGFGRYGFKWSDCTRSGSMGQFHKNGATVEFPTASSLR